MPVNNAWSCIEAAKYYLIFEEILFLMEWRQALVVKVLLTEGG